MSKSDELPDDLADFTATRRTIVIAAIAMGIGALSSAVAFALLRLIGLFTNLFYYRRWSTDFASPSGNTLGLVAVLVPIGGALVTGLMARFGSERIRGHGIPEALEAILTRGSRVEPRVAVLKPISAAVTIGSGGPFGAEGPIIMTGGAVGSMIAQVLRLTAAERKTLLVAGAAAGMSATFAAPIASVLLAVELLLFELKPRSFVPVALASATAFACRVPLLGLGPVFVVRPHHAWVGALGLLGSAGAGIVGGVLAAAMTASVYASEDAFKRLPFHWMWWPAVGGLVVGLGGLLNPRALGVGYDTIEALLDGSLDTRAVLLLVVVKWTIWAVYLGSGTSGGVLAPLLMIGAAAGQLASPFLPAEGAGFWPTVVMGATLAGTMRSPLTGLVFTVELTQDGNLSLPLLVACAVAHGFSVLVLKRSILTEKVARRGFHVTREYAIDPADVLFVRDVMQSSVVALPASTTPGEARDLLGTKLGELEPLYAVVQENDGGGARLAGVVTRRALGSFANGRVSDARLGSAANAEPVTAFPDEPLGDVVERMARTGFTRLPVVTRGDSRELVGLLTLAHTLKATRRHVEEEQRRERVLTLDVLVPKALRGRLRVTDTPVSSGAGSAREDPEAAAPR
ncbi:MAG TPA: chloride channel protein [Polyangiaceae bacterium]|nr:chloride channel protein [Polyangiaceae bacterium]